jgi:hypothetical protein
MLESDHWLTIPVAVGPSAMPVEMIVNPAGMRAVWRTPKWPSPYCADNAADHRTNRPGDHQASAGPENRANSIRLRTRRSNGDRKNRCRSQQTLAHDRPPLSQPSSPAELAANWAMIWHSMWRTTAGSHLRDFFSPLLESLSLRKGLRRYQRQPLKVPAPPRARGSARKTTAPRCAAVVPGWAGPVQGRGTPDPASSRR